MKVYKDKDSDEWWVKDDKDTWWWGASGYNFDDDGKIFLDIVWIPDTDTIPLGLLDKKLLQESSELVFLVLTGKPIKLE